MLRRLAAVVRELPASGIPLGRFAAETCGDAHALDDGRPLATPTVSRARAIGGRRTVRTVVPRAAPTTFPTTAPSGPSSPSARRPVKRDEQM